MKQRKCVDIHTIYGLFLRFFRNFRKRRMMSFLATFDSAPEAKIIDVAGLPYNWNIVGCEFQITFVGLHTPKPANTSERRRPTCRMR